MVALIQNVTACLATAVMVVGFWYSFQAAERHRRWTRNQGVD